MQTKLTPQPGLILAKFPSQKQQTESGIYLPEDKAKKEQFQAIVEAVGSDTKDDTTNVQVGDTIIFSKYGGEQIEINGQTHIFLKFGSVLAIVNKE